MIAAILRAQLLSMRFQVGTRRAGAIFSVITSLVFYSFWVFLAWGAMMFFSSAQDAALLLDALASGLLFVMLYWQLAPVVAASFGAALDLKKLLAYPIPHGKLFIVEVVLRITTCAEMLILVAGASAGLLRNPLFGLRATPFILLGALSFSVLNILLSAGTRNLLERIFLRTRLKEIVVLLLVLAGLAPQFLRATNLTKAALLRFVPSQILWPWASTAHFMLANRAATAALVGLLYLGLAYAYSRWQFQRSLRYDGASSVQRGRVISVANDSVANDSVANDRGIAQRFFAIPGYLLPDPVGALCEKELRTLSRIPRFRLVYAMSCFFGILLYLPQLRNPKPQSFFSQNALPMMGVYGLLMLGQISYWNAFGFDRSAIQGYFSWPIRFRDALVAKNLTTGFLLVPQVLLISIFALVVHLPISAPKILETVAVVLIASLYWFALGNICSVRIPRAMNPDKMSQMTNKLQALSIWSAPILLLPVGLAYWCRYLFHNEWIFAAVLAIAGIIGAIFYYVGLDSAVNTANTRREKLIAELSQSDGPVSIT